MLGQLLCKNSVAVLSTVVRLWVEYHPFPRKSLKSVRFVMFHTLTVVMDLLLTARMDTRSVTYIGRRPRVCMFTPKREM